MRQWLLGAGAVMIVVWIITPPAWAKGRFDGDWNVILSTKEGRVAKDGSFSWGWGHSTGKLSDKEGAGLWVTTAGVRSGNCSGAISLQRQQ